MGRNCENPLTAKPKGTHAFLFLFLNPFLSLLLSVAPPNGKNPPSALPSTLLSVPLFFCFVCSPSLPHFFPLARCGMQTCRNLGLKMIDQTCQFWLLLLKMAAPAVCSPAIGERLSYTRRDWCFRVCPRRRGGGCWGKSEHQFVFAPAVKGASLFFCPSPASKMDALLLNAV